MGEYSGKSFSSLDPETFPEESQMVINFIVDYYRNIENYPVQSQVKPGYLFEKLPKSAPYSPEPLEDILKDVNESIVPGLTHWQSPNFFGYFPASASNAGLLGEMLCSGFNVVGFNWISSPAATELESIVMDWMGKMLNLPSTFLFSGSGGGVIHGTTCEAIVCTLAAARDQVLAKIGHDGITKLVVYCSDQTHFTLRKASRLTGIPAVNFHCIPASFSTKFTLSPEKLQSAIENDIKSGLVPLFLCATIGTTATCAVDPIEELGKIARSYNLWFHIDGAYAGNACICPEFRHYLDGVELADSISTNPHKWFLTNAECCCLWVKKPKSLIQSLAMDSELVRNSASESNSVVDYKDWQISLSRRFRALRLWFVIRRQGQANLMRHIRSDVNMAKLFEGLILKDNWFELVVPRRFALVCFRLKPKNESEGSNLNQRLLGLVNQSGKAFMTHAVVGGIYTIRCAIGATLTEEWHVLDLWKLIQEKAQLLLTQNVAWPKLEQNKEIDYSS